MMSRSFDSPVGRLTVSARGERIASLDWGGEADAAHPLLLEAERQLAAYFADPETRFELPLDLGPDGFRRRFLAALIAIPPGQTRTYGDLARDLSVSAQAIGQACGANPIPIIVPCHRVVGRDGLGGFSGGGGVETKVALLRHEGAAGLLI